MATRWTDLSDKQKEKFGSKEAFKSARRNARQSGGDISNAKSIVQAYKKSQKADTPAAQSQPTYSENRQSFVDFKAARQPKKDARRESAISGMGEGYKTDITQYDASAAGSKKFDKADAKFLRKAGYNNKQIKNYISTLGDDQVHENIFKNSKLGGDRTVGKMEKGADISSFDVGKGFNMADVNYLRRQGFSDADIAKEAESQVTTQGKRHGDAMAAFMESQGRLSYKHGDWAKAKERAQAKKAKEPATQKAPEQPVSTPAVTKDPGQSSQVINRQGPTVDKLPQDFSFNTAKPQVDKRSNVTNTRNTTNTTNTSNVTNTSTNIVNRASEANDTQSGMGNVRGENNTAQRTSGGDLVSGNRNVLQGAASTNIQGNENMIAETAVRGNDAIVGNDNTRIQGNSGLIGDGEMYTNTGSVSGRQAVAGNNNRVTDKSFTNKGTIETNVGNKGDQNFQISGSQFGAGANIGSDYSINIQNQGFGQDGRANPLSNLQSLAAYNALNDNFSARSRSELNGYGRSQGAIEEARAKVQDNRIGANAYNYVGANQQYLRDRVQAMNAGYMGNMIGYEAPEFAMPKAPKKPNLDPAKDMYEDLMNKF